MSYYPRQYPVLNKTDWQFDVREHFAGGLFQDAVLSDKGPQVAPCKEFGIYTTPVIDAGQAVAWRQLDWQSELPLDASVALRTRFGSTQDECLNARWSARHNTSPSEVTLAGSRETYVNVAASRFVQVRAELHAGTGGSPTLTNIHIHAVLVPPACVGPMNLGLIEESSPVFYWTRVEGAASYSLQVANTPEFTDLLVSETDIPRSSLRSPIQLAEGLYYWRVQAADGTGQPSDFSPVRAFTVGPRPHASPSSLRHPYLFFTEADIPAIKKKLFSTHSETWCEILRKADEALHADLPDERDVLSTEGQHGDFHRVAGVYARAYLESLSFAYLISEEEKYAARAREILLHLAGFSRWTGIPFGDPRFVYPTWQSALETSGICKGVATAYDWLYDYLDEDDKAVVREAMLRLGILPAIESWSDPRTIRYVPRHQLPAGNWWSVCNSGAGIGALAVLPEAKDADRWVGLAADAIRAYLAYPGGDVWNIDLKAGWGNQYLMQTAPNWGEDGGYIESMGYIAYGLVNALYFTDALKRVTGEDLTPYINQSLVDQLLYFTYLLPDNTMHTVNFNDSRPRNLVDDLYALLAQHLPSGRAKYLLNLGYPDLQHIHSVMADDENLQPEPPDPEMRNKLFHDIGWCAFRSGWGSQESMLAAKFTHGRGHQDIGQYVIHYKGRPFVIDPIITSYAEASYREHLATSTAHNLVLVDDQVQLRTDGRIMGFAQAPGIGIVEADLTSAYQDLIDSWTRTLVYLEPECFVVIDRLSSDVEHDYTWQVHPLGKVVTQAGIGATISQDDYQMQLRLVSPSDWRVEVKQGMNGPDSVDYLAFSPEKRCKEVTFVGVFAGVERGRTIGIERKEKGVSLGVKVITPNSSHVILTQPREGGQMSGWEVSANATTCVVTHLKGEEQPLVRWAIVGPGPVREGGEEFAQASVSDDYRVGAAHSPA